MNNRVDSVAVQWLKHSHGDMEFNGVEGLEHIGGDLQLY
jgi:hypothetical protein